MEEQPREVKDFAFRTLRRVRIFDSNETKSVQNSIGAFPTLNWLAMSNKYGLLLVGTPNCTMVAIKSKEIHHLVPDKTNLQTEVTQFGHKTVSLPNIPVMLDCNCDGSLLCVCYQKNQSSFAALYDVRVFSDQFTGDVYPFREIRLSASPGAQIRHFQWNPVLPNVFGACCTDGTVIVIEVGDGNKFTVVGTVTLSGILPTCLCWSPKGKQLVVGKNDGTLTQFKPNLQTVKSFPAPSSQSLDNSIQDSIGCVDVYWLSTTEFAVIYAPLNTKQLLLALLQTAKNAPPIWRNFDDICYGFQDDRSWLEPRYFMRFISQWRLVLCGSTIAMEAGILGQDEAMSKWIPWSLDDQGRAELPLDQQKEETWPLGMTIDFTSQLPIRIDESRSCPPMPIMYFLSTNGLLISFSLMNLNPQMPSLNLSPQAVQLSGLRVGSGPKHPAPVPPANSTPIVPTSSFTFVPKTPPRTETAVTVTFTAPTVPVASVPVTVTSRDQTKTQINIKPMSAGHKPQIEKKEPLIAAKVDVTPPEIVSLRKHIYDEITNFESTLATLKQELGTMPISQLGTRPEMVNLSSNAAKLVTDFHEHCGDDKDLLVVESNEIRQRILDASAALEMSKMLLEKKKSPEFLHLMRHKPLDPLQQQRIEDLRNMFTKLQVETIDLETKLIEWQHKNDEKQTKLAIFGNVGHRQADSPRQRILFNRTLANMTAIIPQLTQRLNRLKRRMARLNLTSTITTDSSVSIQSDTSISLRPSSSHSFKNSTILSPEKNERLRHLLEAHGTTHHTTVPKLPVPKFRLSPTKPNKPKTEKPKTSVIPKAEIQTTKPVVPVPVTTSIETQQPVITKPSFAALATQFQKPIAPVVSTKIEVAKPSMAASSFSFSSSKPTTGFGDFVVKKDEPKMTNLTTSTLAFGSSFGKGIDTKSTVTTVTSSGHQTTNTTSSVTAVPFSFGSFQTTKPSTDLIAPNVSVEPVTPTTTSTTFKPNFSFGNPLSASTPAVVSSPPAVAVESKDTTLTAATVVEEAVVEEKKDKKSEKIAVVPDEAVDQVELSPEPSTQELPQPESPSHTEPVPPVEQTVIVPSQPLPTTPHKVTVADVADLSTKVSEVKQVTTAIEPEPQPVVSEAESSVQEVPVPATTQNEEVSADDDMEMISDAPAIVNGASASAGGFSFAVQPSQPTSGGFGDTSNAFGATQSNTADTSTVFGGGGGFLGGLGGAPSSEAAKKNVFGSGMTFGSSSQQPSSSSLFGSNPTTSTTGGSVFGTPASFGASSPASSSFSGSFGSVGQQGFGASANQSPTFGGGGAFGSKATFGANSPIKAFGSSPTSTFGSGSVFGSAAPTSGQAAPVTGGFSQFATQPGPSFGAIASSANSVFGGASSFSGTNTQTGTSVFGGSNPLASSQQATTFSGWRG